MAVAVVSVVVPVDVDSVDDHVVASVVAAVE